jgi:site-specific DNA-cytosine methylase
MLNAIEWLDPKLVVIENVSALRSARSEFSEEVRVPGPRGGARLARTHRALGVVLADLAWLGYDARWGSVRAADVGAPHRRERVFVLAYPGVTGLEGLGPAESQRWDGAADSEQLKILGNGVVPQQAALALELLLVGVPC